MEGALTRFMFWTKGEIKALRETYPRGTLEKITDALPDRSYDAITVKASRLRIKRIKPTLSLRDRINVDPLVNLYNAEGRQVKLRNDPENTQIPPLGENNPLYYTYTENELLLSYESINSKKRVEAVERSLSGGGDN